MNRWSVVLAAVLAGCGGAGEVTEDSCEPLLGAAAFAQGELVASDSQLDLALDGPGFFVLAKGEEMGFTRRGHFTVGAEGHVMGPLGYRLQSSSNGATPVDLVLGPAVAPSIPTRRVVVKANLDAAAVAQVFEPSDPAASSAMQSTVGVVDELGRLVRMDLFWTRVGVGEWDMHALVDGSPGVPMEVAAATLRFDSSGRLVSYSQESTEHELWFDFGDPMASGGTGLAGVTQFAGASATLFTGSDGMTMGFLRSFEFNSRGELLGSYSNGAVLVLGHAALANFTYPMGLRREQDFLLVESVVSGAVLLGSPSEAGFGAVVPGALEVLTDLDACH